MECSIFEFSSKFTFKESDREVEHRREIILIPKKKSRTEVLWMLFLFYFFISSVCFITFAGKMSIDEYEFPRLSLHDFYGDFNINLISVTHDLLLLCEPLFASFLIYECAHGNVVVPLTWSSEQLWEEYAVTAMRRICCVVNSMTWTVKWPVLVGKGWIHWRRKFGKVITFNRKLP